MKKLILICAVLVLLGAGCAAATTTSSAATESKWACDGNDRVPKSAFPALERCENSETGDVCIVLHAGYGAGVSCNFK